ncbi:unnamed protein product [Auanema sp. JU1783]|nr:unnamed protein product [Auanema sp. JU1783]
MPLSDELSIADSKQNRRNSLSSQSSETCRVCGDGNAKTHYGVVTCFGCKGFFRRTLKRPSEYQCRYNGNCVVDRHERNSCRYCRYKKCIEVGMDPKAVRPDRDATGRHFQGRQRRSKINAEEEQEIDTEWMRKLPVDMRTTLLQLMNIDLVVGGTDGGTDSKVVYPLPIDSIRHALEDPAILDGKRTEMRYEGYREINPIELPSIAHRTLIAVIDWVDHLFDAMDIQGLEDKLTMVRHAYAPLMVFNFSSNTARNCKKNDLIYLCSHGYVPRDCCQKWTEPFHFANNLAPQALDDLIIPLRKMNMKEEEAALLKAIIILNPNLKCLSLEASEAIADMRDRVQETLYYVVRETHPKEVASSRFGNLLLFVPNVMMIGRHVLENLQFIANFEQMQDQMLKSLLQQEESVQVRPQELEYIPDAVRRNSDPRMSHSASSSSVESLSSYPSSSSNSYQEPESAIPYNFSSNSLPATPNQLDNSLNSASSMPNLEQMADCDPDYNVTLTPDMFSDMRQAMSVAHNMDTSCFKPSENQMIQQPPVSPSAERPTFYIESTKHKFAVTTFDGYPSGNYPVTSMTNGIPMASLHNVSNSYNQLPQHHTSQNQASHPQQSQSPQSLQQQQQHQQNASQQSQQQPLTKTNSLPPNYYNFDSSQYNSMDYEESFY